MNAKWKEIEDRDACAKGHNTLVGRYIKYPYADGHAIYEVYAVQKGIAHVQNTNYGDGWHFPMIEQMECKLPIGLIKANIDERESWEAMFKKL